LLLICCPTEFCSHTSWLSSARIGGSSSPCHHGSFGDDLTRTSEVNPVFILLGSWRTSVLLLRRRWRTQAPGSAMTNLSGLSREPNRRSLAHEYLLLRRLTLVAVVWHPGDPPAHYKRCGHLEEFPLTPRSGYPHTPKISSRRRTQYPLAKKLRIFKVGSSFR